MPRKKTDLVSVNLRLPRKLLRAVDAHVKKMRVKSTRVTYTRTDFIREIVYDAMKQREET